jgi:glutamine amidotransferase
MCLLTCFKPGVQPDMVELTRGADHNSDGHGWALIADGEILTDRGMDAATVLEQFRLAREAHPDGWAFFHSRIGTAGTMDEFNCHPFPTGPSRRDASPLTYVAHNGVLPRSSQPGLGDKRSDTHLFADKMLPERFFHLDSPKTRKRLESWLGSFNKIVVLTVDPRYREQFYLFNESQGTWKGGIWYSNQNHCHTYSEYSWSYEPSRSGRTTKTWWEDAEGAYDEYPSARTMGPRQPGIWVSGGREGATFFPDDTVTAKQLATAAQGPYYATFICRECRVLGRISRETRLCDYCNFCDLCSKYSDDCRCAKFANGRKVGSGPFAPAHFEDILDHFTDEELDGMSAADLQAYADFVAESDAADEAARYGF